MAFFNQETLDFLTLLKANNSRDWFNQHKSEYEAKVRSPALDFIAAAQPYLHDISLFFDAIPAKVGGSMMRPYRDTRFSKDKSPYKTNIGIQFRHQAGKDVHAPGFYLHIEPAECFLGVGCWHPDAATLSAIRQRIVAKPKVWTNVVEALTSASFELVGESLKRPPRGFDAEHPMIEDIKRKDFIALHPLAIEQVCDDKLLSLCFDLYRKTSKLPEFICKSIGVAY